MHILFLCSSFPYPDNNPYKYTILQTIKALYRKGVQITVVAQVAQEEMQAIESIPEEVRKWAHYYMIEVAQKISFIDSIATFLFSKNSIEIADYYSSAVAEELKKILAQNPPDIVQIEGISMAVYMKDIPLEKCIMRIHDYDSQKYLAKIASTLDVVRKNYYQTLKKRLEEWEWKQVFSSKLKRVLINDSSFKRAIGEQLMNRFALAPNLFTTIHGIDFSKILSKENLEIEPNSVYWMGSLASKTAQAALVWFIQKVWKKVYAAYPQAKLFIAALNRPENFLTDVGITQGVKWEKSLENIYEFMASKAIMVLPMLSFSGQQMKILEAMALGNAIVASREAVQAIPAKHGEHLFIAKDEQAFINLLSTLIEHPNIALTMGKIAKNWVRENLSEEKMDDRLVRFYEGV